MMMPIQRGLLLVLVVCTMSWPGHVHAASADDAHIIELQAKINALEQQAAAKRAIIATTQQQAATLKKAVAELQSQIAAVQAEISVTHAKIDMTTTQIGTVQDNIQKKSSEMSRKRETIGRMVLFLDQVDQENLIASLFKYRSLSDFIAQIHDIANVQHEILDVIGDIKTVKASLETDKTDLESQQEQLQQLNEDAAQKASQLVGVKGEKAHVLSVTKGQESAYQKQLAQIEAEKTAIFQEMQKLEHNVIAGGLFIVHVTASAVPAKGTKLFKLPEDNSHLTQGYGCTKYARCGRALGPYGGAPHNGVDYSAGFGSPIKAIGAGQIVAHGTNDGWGNWIAVQHPNNLVSIYGHMSSFAPLVVGSEVNQGQVIGYEGHTGQATGSHVHLSLYKDFFTFLNAKGQLYFNYFVGSLNPLEYL